MRKHTRRTFLVGGHAMAGALALPVRALTRTSAAHAAPSITVYPFTLGVASGEPAPDSVVPWTRLAPSPLNADGQGGMVDTDVVVDCPGARPTRSAATATRSTR
jgi:alkaline phosphatase D